MHSLGGALIVLGICIAFSAQVYGAMRTFRVSTLDGVLCLLVPWHVLFVAKRDGYYSHVVAIWAAGIICIVIGTFVLA